MATIKGTTQENLKRMLGEAFTKLVCSSNVHIDEVSIVDHTREAPYFSDQVPVRGEIPTGKRTITITYTDSEVEKKNPYPHASS